MKKRSRFAISSLSIAGLIAPAKSAAGIPIDEVAVASPKQERPALFDVFRQQHAYTLAQHRSHQSHSSHSSHRSSSGGSSRGVPTPRYVPSPPPPPPPPQSRSDSTAPSTILPSAPPKTLRGNTALFSEIVFKVQAGLYSRGYYTGQLDGLLGDETRAAITKFQVDQKLEITGSITSEVLDALGIMAQ